MKRTYISTLVLAATVIMPAAALAAGEAPATSRPAPSAERNPVDRTADTSAMTFKSFDANKDGYISKEEAKNSNELNKQFADLDKDRDGKLSAQELGGWKAQSQASARSEPQTAGRSSLPRAPRSEPTEPGAGAGSRSMNPAPSGTGSR